MKTNISTSSSPFTLRILLTSNKEFTFRKLHVALIIFIFFNIIFTQAQIGQNDPTFNSFDNVATSVTNGSIKTMALQSDEKIIIATGVRDINGKLNAKTISRLEKDGKIDTTFNAGLIAGGSGYIISVAIQTDDKIVIGGSFTSYNGISCSGIVRLTPNGSFDYSFAPAASGYSKILIQPDGKILINGLIRLNQNGSLDNTFHPPLNVEVVDFALQPDGKIIIGDWKLNFDSDGQRIGDSQYFIRLNSNGTRDSSFESKFGVTSLYASRTNECIVVNADGDILVGFGVYEPAVDNPYRGTVVRLDASDGHVVNAISGFYINTIQVQKDGQFIVAGINYDSDGYYYNRPPYKKNLVRVNKFLTIDSTFKFTDYQYSKYEANILTAILQSDKIIIGGEFLETNDHFTPHIARLNSDGGVDNSFNKRSGCNGKIVASALQANEKIIVGGVFDRYNFDGVSNIARLEKDGNLDPSFQTGTGPNGKVYAIAIQPDGKIIIGGQFKFYNGNSCQNIARLNSNGSFDASFNSNTDYIIKTIVIDQSGKIIIGGDFLHVNGASITGVARLQTNGLLDLTFNPTLPNYFRKVSECKVSKDGKIYVIAYQNTSSSILLRLNNDGSEDSTFQIANFPYNLFIEFNTVTLNDDGTILAGGTTWNIVATVSTNGDTIYLKCPASGCMDKIGVVKLKNDGSVDHSFIQTSLDSNKVSPLGNISTINVLANNKIIVTGDFHEHIWLLNSDGTLDSNFVGITDEPIYTSRLQGNDKMIIAGDFKEYASTTRNCIARILLNELSPTGINDVTTKQLNIYPNPANGIFQLNTIQVKSNTAHLLIYNELGENVYSTNFAQLNNGIINLSSQPNGIYFVNIYDGATIYSNKISIQH